MLPSRRRYVVFNATDCSNGQNFPSQVTSLYRIFTTYSKKKQRQKLHSEITINSRVAKFVLSYFDRSVTCSTVENALNVQFYIRAPNESTKIGQDLNCRKSWIFYFNSEKAGKLYVFQANEGNKPYGFPL